MHAGPAVNLRRIFAGEKCSLHRVSGKLQITPSDCRSTILGLEGICGLHQNATCRAGFSDFFQPRLQISWFQRSDRLPRLVTITGSPLASTSRMILQQ